MEGVMNQFQSGIFILVIAILVAICALVFFVPFNLKAWRRNRRALRLAKKYNKGNYQTTEEQDQAEVFCSSGVLEWRFVNKLPGSGKLAYVLSENAREEVWREAL